MTEVVVLVPVLGRPHRAAPVAESIRSSDARATPLFLCSPEDADEIAACRACPDAWVEVVSWPVGRGDYARKMNRGFDLARGRGFEWVFLGADDLVFHDGWFDACLGEHARTNACVVGTNDMGNARVMAGHHSTHTLVHTDYAECGTVDDSTRLLHEGYWHNYVDDEFVQTAMSRGTYAHAYYSMVEHLHPNWAKGKDDETYRRGLAHFSEDERLFAQRSPMFGSYTASARSRRRSR